MLRRNLQSKQRRSSFPQTIRSLRKNGTFTTLEPIITAPLIGPLITAPKENVNVTHSREIEAFQLLLDSQRAEIADREAELKSMRLMNRDITISTVPVTMLMGIPTFKTVETWAMQFLTNKNLRVMENISSEAREAIDLKANSKRLSIDDAWTTYADSDIIVMVKACYPQKSEGEELSANQFIQKNLVHVAKLFPAEKGSARWIHEMINFCNLLPLDKANDVILQKEWVALFWKKIPSNMHSKKVLHNEIMALTTLKSFFYRFERYHYDIAQQNIPSEDNGFLVTPDPTFGFHYLSSAGKRKDFDRPEGKLAKPQKPESTAVNCTWCGRNSTVLINGKPYPHTKKYCFCEHHVDKNTSDQPWSNSPNGISYKSLGLNNLPHNKKLSGDRKSMIDYSMPKKELSGEH
jgi:hypothetical protein